MTEDTPRGRFVWFDLMTTQPEAAQAFYTAVTGWGTQKWDAMPYTMWTNNGSPLGGIMALPNPAAPVHWLAYISTPDVDQTAREATELGARVMVEPSDIPTVGRYAVIADPQGAVFAAFTSLNAAPGHEGEPQLGEFSWHELATHDYPAAFRFYERLFGWEKTSAMDMGPAGTYQMYGRNGVVLGGMFNRSPEMPAPSWTFYIRVEDVESAAETVKSRGGHVVTGPMEVPGGDKVAICVDPQGGAFAVHAKKKS